MLDKEIRELEDKANENWKLYQETVFQLEAAKAQRDKALLQNEEYLVHLETAWAIIASAGMAGNIGNWKLLDPIWVKAAEEWRDKWHTILDKSLKRKDQVDTCELGGLDRRAIYCSVFEANSQTHALTCRFFQK